MKRTQMRKVSPKKVKKPKARDSAWWQKKCDSLMQDINRLRFETCEVCGNRNEVAHHFITKAQSSFLRYDFRNLCNICHKCHFNIHIRQDSSIQAKILWNRGKVWHDWLEKVRRTPQQTGIGYYKKVYADLEELYLHEKELKVIM